MDNLIEFLPELISYIVLGFVFLRVFRYMCTIKNSENYEHIVWESILVGFVFKNLFALIPFSINQAIDMVGMVITTIIVAGIWAKIYSSKLIDNFFRKIGVFRTRQNYIWQDIEDKNYMTYVRVVNPDTSEAYAGTLKYYEEYKEHPQIVLQNFQYWGKKEEDNRDFSKDPKCVVLIDTEKFSQIYIVYQPESDKVKNKDNPKK